MRFISETTSNGVSERLFTLGDVPGVLWSPIDATGSRPLVLLGHGGGQHKRAAGEPLGPDVARHNAALAARAVPEWQATLDALQRLDLVGAGGPVGFWGVSLGSAIGVPLTAAEPRITAAVFGLAGHEPLAEAAATVTVPVEFLLQWDDELVPRDAGLALFGAFSSREKTLHANPGRHAGVPAFELESSERFFTRHLLRGDAPAEPAGSSAGVEGR
jgi:hypothetical protein